MRRLTFVGAVGLIAISLLPAAASSLDIARTYTVPAQGTVTVASSCAGAVSLSYVYESSSGTVVLASSGYAYYVYRLVVSQTSGTDCHGYSAALGFGRSWVPTNDGPIYFSGTGYGTWTFTFATRIGSPDYSRVAAYDPGSVTVTIYRP